MTTHKEALKLLVKALSLYETRTDGLVNKALAAGKEALAQPEQSTTCGEPVAVVETIGGYPDESAHVAKWLVPYKSLKAGDKLYTTPPQRTWVGLTDEERGHVYASWRFNGSNSSNLELCRAIEAKLKEKNA